MDDSTRAARIGKWREFYRELKAIAEPSERRLVEYQKASVEFSKILVTMLYAINAGGLIGLPTIAGFAGLSMQTADRIWLLKSSAVFFGAGLLAAGLCALLCQLNYRLHADRVQNDIAEEFYRHSKITDFYGEETSLMDEDKRGRDTEAKKRAWWLDFTNNFAYFSGFVSIGIFLTGCWWIGSRIV